MAEVEPPPFVWYTQDMERIPFEAGAYYHIYNRGTEKRDIFLSDRDYRRFIHCLYVCNDTLPVDKLRGDDQLAGNTPNSGGSTSAIEKVEKLVDIVAYALMPNHFHLLICPKTDTSLSKFMQKVVTGYTMYFNQKHKRSGALLQGRFKSKEVANEQYLPILARYIHLNPIDLFRYDSRKKRSLLATHKDFLRNYRWSSYPDYIGVKNFPSILSPGLFWEIFQDMDEHKEFIFEALEGDGGEEDPALQTLIFKEK